ncbi:MAG: hypothetical protein U0271_07220 [Polyangiaceae bacterium]
MSSLRSLLTFVACSAIAVVTAGCPSQNAVDIHAGNDPIETPKDPVKKETTREHLAKNRARHLEQLNAYWKAKSFPINRDLNIIGNVFRDEDGHLCAVANMIDKDGGNADLLDETAKNNNFIRLIDVHEGPLYDWVLTSGFTQEEIAMIQVPYMPERQVNLDEERERISARLADVEERLRDDTELSLGVAERRLVAANTLGTIRWASN